MFSDLNMLLNENMTRVPGGWQCRLCQKIDTKEINQNGKIPIIFPHNGKIPIISSKWKNINYSAFPKTN